MSGLLKPIHYQRPKGNFSPVRSLAFFPRREDLRLRESSFRSSSVKMMKRAQSDWKLEKREKRSLNIRVSDVHSASVLVGDSSAIHRRFIGDSRGYRKKKKPIGNCCCRRRSAHNRRAASTCRES